MRQRREALQRRSDAARARVHACVEEARRYGEAGQRALAIEALRRKTLHERDVKNAGDLLRTLDQQLSAIDTASLSASVASSMRDGATVMSSVHADLDVAAVERSMVDMRIKARETEQVTRLMTRPLFDHDDGYDDVDEDEQSALDEELAALLASSSPLPDVQLPTVPQDEPVVLPRRTLRDAEREFGL